MAGVAVQRATHAAAALSRSFSAPPRDSCRTLAVAVVLRSTTGSLLASSHDVKCQPSPSAFSTAHRGLGMLCPGQHPAVLPELSVALIPVRAVDLIRQSIRLVMQELIESEATERMGPDRCERTESRVPERNGCRSTLFSTI